MELTVGKIQKIDTSTREEEKTIHRAILEADHKKVVLTQEEEFEFVPGDVLELAVKKQQSKLV